MPSAAKRNPSFKVALLSLTFVLPVAQAEQRYDITDCGSMTSTVYSASEALTILTFDFRGIARSNSPDQVFDNCTVFYMGAARSTPRTTTAHGYTKYLDPDGDFVVMESVREGDETKMTFLQGTGRWEGIKGGGVLRRVAAGKPILAGTSQYCTRHTGSFELPKK